MKIFLSALLVLVCFAFSGQSAPPHKTPDQLANMADTFYVPTNKVEWKCSAAILGPLVTNDVIYVVKNIQTNRCGVFVVSYPTQPTPRAPVILEWLADPRPVLFRLKTMKMPIHPNAPATFSGIEVVEHVEITLGPLTMSDGQRHTYYAYVDIGRIFYTSQADVMIGRVSEEILRLRRFGK